MRADALARALRGRDGPAIVCAQAGDVNTGAFDPFEEIARPREPRAAPGCTWTAPSACGRRRARRRHLVAGVERADSWATDAHKWLNVPYDSGLAIVRDPEALRPRWRARPPTWCRRGGRDPHGFVPEASRRARAVPVYAALRALGREGVADLVERCCELAAQMARSWPESSRSSTTSCSTRFSSPSETRSAPTGSSPACARTARAGWAAPSFRGRAAIRISVINWSTTPEDISRSAQAILAAARAEP